MIKAVIFDMDGVISDTQKLHASIESELLKRYGIDLEPGEITRRYAGVPDDVFLNEVSEVYRTKIDIDGFIVDIDGFIDEKWMLMVRATQGGVDPIPGSLELIEELREAGFKLAVASSSIRVFIDTVLGTLNIRNNFDAIVSIEDVERGKPNPEIFLLAARRMGVKPNECVVIEDAISGIKAAKRAGMRSILLIRDKVPLDVDPDAVIEDLRDLNIDFLLSL
jgi:beta-phosphoglucomutase family hydrolase